MNKYNLTNKELTEIKRRCKVAGLRWQAMAARPAVAKQILADKRLDV